MNTKQTAPDKEIERVNLITRICTRAEEMGIRRGSRITATMDVNLAGPLKQFVAEFEIIGNIYDSPQLLEANE